MVQVNFHIKKRIQPVCLVVLALCNCALFAQPASLNFRHLTTANGLSDPVVRSIARDKYGYIWLGTQNGLNRFNGYDVKIFQHKNKDSFSLAENNVPVLFCDANGTLWVPQSKGIYRYDYSTDHFILQQRSAGIVARKMLQADKDHIYLSTTKGMVLFDTKTSSFTFLDVVPGRSPKYLLTEPVNDFCLDHDGKIFIATDTGLVIYNPANKSAEKAELSPVKKIAISKIAIDKRENLWMTYDKNATVMRTDKAFSKYDLYTQFQNTKNNFTDNQVNSILADAQGRIWVTTIRQGLGLYDTATHAFKRYVHDPLQSFSIATNFTTFLYQDSDGFIWTGTEGYGVEYFHADRNLFHSIQQSFNQKPTLPDNWCRASGEDKNGNLWLGTASGLARYDYTHEKFTTFRNEGGHVPVLYANSIRSVLCDEDEVWIGANGGLNRYHISSGKMDFLGEKEGVPLSFFWTIIRDHSANIWFGCREGLFRYNHLTKKIENFTGDDLLGPYCHKNVRSLFEDSHHRLWIGFYSEGLLMFDATQRRVKYFPKNIRNANALHDGAITSITEDRSGIIWLSTFSGFSSYNADTNTFRHFLDSDEGTSEITSSLMCDDRNRLWIAATSGLYMLDSARRLYRSFGLDDGLPTIDFNGQSAFRMHNGNFIFPTLKGFIFFDPDDYAERKDNAMVYVSSFTIFGNEYNSISSIEQTNDIRLEHDQNFFSVQMTAINYDNLNHNWYAHKLVPFDKDWIYSETRTVNYTNVPGGNYIFHYKTSTDRNKWNKPEKTMHIYVDTIFYKTWWFRSLGILCLTAGLYRFYKYRITQKENVLMLQKKAYSLEKEKALAMYESLKQQLNPHFLFNSLTSLSSLISSNPANAKRFLESLSRIYRYILKSRDTETVSLADEIKLAVIYMQLQKTRFKEGLKWKMEVPEECMHLKIAPVTLQNLIENAIKHNIIDVHSPLVIHIFEDHGWLLVKNNLQRKTIVETSNKQGLTNLQSLYNYLSGRQLIIIEDENYFTIKVPLI